MLNLEEETIEKLLEHAKRTKRKKAELGRLIIEAAIEEAEAYDPNHPTGSDPKKKGAKANYRSRTDDLRFTKPFAIPGINDCSHSGAMSSTAEDLRAAV